MQVNTKELITALKVCNRVAQTKGVRPILAYALYKRGKLTATNIETTVEIDINLGEVDFTMPVKESLKNVKAYSKCNTVEVNVEVESITSEVTEDPPQKRWNITIGGITGIQGLDPEEFPDTSTGMSLKERIEERENVVNRFQGMMDAFDGDSSEHDIEITEFSLNQYKHELKTLKSFVDNKTSLTFMAHEKMCEVAYAASGDVNKRILNSVLIDPTFGVVATDGHRMALRPYTFPQGTLPIVVPTKLLGVASYAFQGKKPKYCVEKMFLECNRIRYEGKGITIEGTALEGSFPEYRRVVPELKSTQYSFYLPWNIAEQLAPGAALINNYYCGMKWTVNGSVKAEFNDPTVKPGNDDKKCIHWETIIQYGTRLDKMPDAEYTVSFNHRYLMDIQKAMNTAMIIHLTEPQSPGVITNNKGEVFGIVMPMML